MSFTEQILSNSFLKIKNYGTQTINGHRQVTDNSKTILYKIKPLMIVDIWQPHEVAKIKAASFILKARHVSELQAEDNRRFDVLAQELLEKPVQQFEQKIVDKNLEFQIAYTTEDDTLVCGNTIVPFFLPKPPKHF